MLENIGVDDRERSSARNLTRVAVGSHAVARDIALAQQFKELSIAAAKINDVRYAGEELEIRPQLLGHRALWHDVYFADRRQPGGHFRAHTGHLTLQGAERFIQRPDGCSLFL